MINTIFHISDVHIRLYRRCKEYQLVLEQLVLSIQSLKTDKSMIVVTGDLFHSKTEMSPESITMATAFLTALSSTLPTVLIAGNHDANLANLSRLDSITPIVELIKSDNLVYYKDTGWYKYDNINFYVNSVFNEKFPDEYPTDGVNICLYHGVINSSMLGTGYKFTTGYSTDVFSKFDFVLLGDIHKSQVLSTTPLVAYAGSLMQLNYGEEIDRHGYLLWDLDKHSVQHVVVRNDYAYYNLIAENGALLEPPEITATHPRIKLKYNNCNSTELKQIQKYIRDRYTPDQIMLSRTQQASELKSSTFKFNLDNIDDPEYQQKIIRQYIQHAELNFTNQQIKAVIEINNSYNTLLRGQKVISQFNIWSLVKFEFSNLFSYGQGNVIEFNKYRGLVGILGENRSGKSSLLDAILFMLYDRTSKTNKAISILNNEKDELSGKIEILVNEKQYFIQKSGKRNKRGDNIAVKCKFYTYTDSGQMLDLSGTERSETVKIIQQYIGTYQDLNATSFSTQGNSNSFIELPNTNRKTLLNSLLNLTIFDKCFNQANERTKQLRGYLNGTDIATVERRIDQIKDANRKLKTDIEEYESDLSDLKAVLIQYETRLRELRLNKKVEQQFLIDIEDIQDKITKLNSTIDALQKVIKQNGDQYKTACNNLGQLQIVIQQCGIEEKRTRLAEVKIEYDLYLARKSELNIQSAILRQQQKKLLLLASVEYDQNCSYCMGNPLTKDAVQSKGNVVVLQAMVDALQLECSVYEQTIVPEKLLLQSDIHQYDKELMHIYNQSITEKARLLQKISEDNTRLYANQTELSKLLLTKSKYQQHQKIIQQNIILHQEIDRQQGQLDEVSGLINAGQQSLLKCQLTLATNEQALKNNKTIQKKYDGVNNQFVTMERYKSLIGRSGIQYYITTNIISILQQEINRVLQMISNFNIEFMLDGKSVDINIIYPNKSYQIETCSGFEKFIISIAIRYALSTMSNKSKAKLFVIDEGFGVMDSENITQLNKILDFLSEKYETLFVISHLEVMKSMFQKIIQVQYKQGVSKIA